MLWAINHSFIVCKGNWIVFFLRLCIASNCSKKYSPFLIFLKWIFKQSIKSTLWKPVTRKYNNGQCKHTKPYNEAISLVLLFRQAIRKCRKLIKISITSLGLVLLSKYSISLNFCLILFDSCENITHMKISRVELLLYILFFSSLLMLYESGQQLRYEFNFFFKYPMLLK